MTNLERATSKARYIKIATKNSGYTIDANCWLNGERGYTIIVRTNGETIEEAAKVLLDKMSFLKVEKNE